MTTEKVEREEYSRPLAPEIHIAVQEHQPGRGPTQFPGYMVIVVRESKLGPGLYDTQKLMVRSFVNPSHDDTKKKHDANGLAEGLGKIFGVRDVRFA
jgi:hypothetical protein